MKVVAIAIAAPFLAVAALALSNPASVSKLGAISYSTATSAAAMLAPAASGFTTVPNAPIVLNATVSAQPGDIVFLQGANFGTNPSVSLESAAGAQSLPLINQVGNWVAVKIPTSASGAIMVRIANGGLSSAPVAMNAARGYHFDALKIVPGAKFRIFGRNLLLAGSTAKVTVDGQAATIDSSQSDENMLTVAAPTGLAAKTGAVVAVDNGNGSGASPVARTVQVVSAPAESPFDPSAGWTGTFRPLTGRAVEIACGGGRSISQQVSDQIQRFGPQGGIIQFTAGACTLDRTIDFKSNIVIQGQGKWATIVTYSTNYPLYAQGLSNIGLRNLTLKNGGQAQEGPIIKNNDGVILQNVVMDFGRQRQSFLDGNSNILVTSCDFFQRGTINQQSPYLFNRSKGLIFTNNWTEFVMGAASFQQVSDAYISGNTFVRDAAAQNDPGTLHMLTIDFATRIAVVGNTFTTMNGSITNRTRNDGESLLTEGGGAGRTENLGTVASAGQRTLYDPSLALNVDPLGTGGLPENYGLAIVAGKGVGQTRYITGFSGNTITVDRDWEVIPDTTSKYATFVWGLEKSLIKNNKFQGMPRGIWLYQTAVRDVDVVGNQFTEGGGIYLRAYQNLSAKMFDAMYNVRIKGNTVSNTAGRWPSYMTAVFVNSDARAFGTGMMGISFDGNAVVANAPNLSLNTEEYAGNEGYLNLMRVENYGSYEPLDLPRILGTILFNNACTNCAIGYRLGTGAGGTVIVGARNTNVAQFWENARTTSSGEYATSTVIQ